METELIPLTKKAAAGDVGAAQQLLALFAEQAIPPIGQEQVHIYVKQAARQHPEALYLRAQLYEKGYGVAVDYDMAFLLMREAASKGYALAVYEVGRHFLHGIGVAQSHDYAARWLKLAASSPYYVPDAMYELALMYETGHGVALNRSIAKGWLESAATAGHQGAQKHLANYST